LLAKPFKPPIEPELSAELEATGTELLKRASALERDNEAYFYCARNNAIEEHAAVRRTGQLKKFGPDLRSTSPFDTRALSFAGISGHQ
jgi:hypothetical protein